ncbi:MAG: hypothetical protein LAT51_12475 [Flavobacteriaceae bacterium]|nr:hypothetical protein [Flavobacteriaceae bacterium]
MRKITFFILLILVFSSCSGLLTRYVISKADIQKDLKILKSDSTNQVIAFIPVVHIAKEQYYLDIRKVVDSLRNEGYNFYYENMTHDPELDSAKQVIYDKKIRSILGYSTALNEKNKSLPKVYTKKAYMLQDYNLMGLNKNDTHLDMFKSQVIDSIEKNRGKIKLSSCDLSTDLMEEYICDAEYKHLLFDLTNQYRDQYIAQKILELKDEKIALIYGKMHWNFIYGYLRINDKSLYLDHGSY